MQPPLRGKLEGSAIQLQKGGVFQSSPSNRRTCVSGDGRSHKGGAIKVRHQVSSGEWRVAEGRAEIRQGPQHGEQPFFVTKKGRVVRTL